MYPNPANAYVNIQIKESITEQVKVELFNVTGQAIFVKQLNEAQHTQLIMEHLPSGIYFINVVVGSNNHLIKIIKN